MMHTTRWTVSISLFEEGHLTTASAILQTGDTEHMRGRGSARRNPHAPSVPEIGDELAAARALADLSHQLLDAAVTDIEAITGQPAGIGN